MTTILWDILCVFKFARVSLLWDMRLRVERKPRIAILVNIIAPYRVPIYRALARWFDVAIFISGFEQNRSIWSGAEKALGGLSVKQVWGMSIAIPQRDSGRLFDWWHIHINPGYFPELVRYAPDVIISSEMGFRSLVAVIYGFLFRVPVLVWWGGTIYTERSNNLVKRLWRRLFSRWVPRWISYGLSSTEYLLSLGISRERILQIQNCVDESLFTKPVPPTFSLAPRPVLLYVGQLIGRKGVDLLLEAGARVQGKGYEFTLALVGSGPEQRRLEAKAEALALRHVHFLGPRSPGEMPSVYRSADVLVFPTLGDVWGLVVNEALWSGLPVISSIYAGCTPEIVPPENRFDPLDPTSFDDALERAISGKIAPPDTSRLWRWDEVARKMAEDILGILR